MAYMTFMHNEDQVFYYRNSVTKDSIVFCQEGQLISCGNEALRYRFECSENVKMERLPRHERFVHPNVTRWMAKHLDTKAENKYGEEVCIFLQEFWGPIVNYDFSDLKTGYPIKGVRTRCCLYLYPSDFEAMIAIRFVGDEIVEKRCSYAQYSRYEEQERELFLDGWHVITIIRELLDRDPDRFRLYISKAIELADSRNMVYILTERGRDM